MRQSISTGVSACFRLLSACAMAASVVIATPAFAATPKGWSSSKYAAIVVDAVTGRVLYEDNADARRYPASLTKMMTLYVLFEDLERGRVKLDTPLKVSANAAAQAPSKLGLKAGSTIAVSDAIKGLVTKSANDASAVIAENLAGSVPAFADRMTRTAHAIGMSNTIFRNANGLPNPGQYTSARDMMKLGVALQVRFPNYYGFFKTASFTYKGKTHGNHNRLLGRIDGVDGIKTGYIAASGFNLVTSVNRNGRRLVAVVMGGKSGKSRDAHMVNLIETYLPKAGKGKSIDSDLIAKLPAVAVKEEVAVAAVEDVAPKATGIGPHPLPVARPIVLAAAHSAGPEVVPVAALPPPAPEVEVAAAYAEAPKPRLVMAGALSPLPNAAPVPGSVKVRTLSLPVEPEVASAELPPANLPNSAAEAFADVAPLASDEEDALAAMIEKRLAGFEVASAEPVTMTDSEPMAMPRSAPETIEVAPQAAPKRKTAAAIDGWIVQIGAVGSEAEANRLMQKAQSKVGKVLAKASPITEPFAKNGQTYIRARFAGFANQDAAKKACAALKKNDFACFTVKL